MKKIYLFSMFTLGIVLNSFGQSTEVKAASDEAWLLLKEEAGIKIYYAPANCGAEKSVLWKLENTTEEALTITLMKPKTVADNTMSDETTFLLQINAKSETQGMCQIPNTGLSPYLIWKNTDVKTITPESIELVIN